MKKWLLLSLLTVAFVVQYEGHYWSPCSENVCLAISCAPQGCYTEGSTTFCADEQCVNSIIEKSGEKHLIGVWKISWDGYLKRGQIEEMKPVKSYRIELKKK